jgi:hypothetical protein
MKMLFRLTLLEILAGTGWVLLPAVTVLLYFAIPLVSGAIGEGVVLARGQGACAGILLSGLYCVMVAGRVGDAQVSRGANLYYRAFGVGDFPRWAGVSGACLFPLVTSSVVGGAGLLWNYWTWYGSFLEGAVSILQFVSLVFLMFSIIVSFVVGASARFGYGPGALAGVGLLVFGNFFPQLLSLAVGGVPALEIVWALVPHLYALDWSPSVVYLWGGSPAGDYFITLAYGLGWLLVLGVSGLGLFLLSPNQHE